MDWQIIGHEWAAQILQKHIQQNSVRHAYLFSGAPGIGRRSLAVRFATPSITSGELERLRDLLRRAESCGTQEQMGLRRELNTEFHLSICRASRHRYLVHQIESLWRWFPSVMLYEGMRRQEALAPARLARELDEHRAILAALEARDARAAENEVRRHIGNLSQELTEVLGVSPALIELLFWP